MHAAKFIIHGEADELISIKDVRKFYSLMPEPKELVTIEDANHLFEGKTSMVVRPSKMSSPISTP